MKIVREHISFERGDDPLKNLNIGKKAIADNLEWDWTPYDDFEEEFVDLIPYPDELDPDLAIKIVKLKKGGKYLGFVGIDNLGEPYNTDPETFNTKEEAIEKEKAFLDQYWEEFRG